MAPNVAGLVAYLFGIVSGILLLVIEPYKNDRFVRFHAFQAIFFTVAVFAIMILLTILSTMLAVIAGPLVIIMFPIGLIVYLGIFVYWIVLMYKAYSNERHMIPFIGELAAKQAG